MNATRSAASRARYTVRHLVTRDGDARAVASSRSLVRARILARRAAAAHRGYYVTSAGAYGTLDAIFVQGPDGRSVYDVEPRYVVVGGAA